MTPFFRETTRPFLFLEKEKKRRENRSRVFGASEAGGKKTHDSSSRVKVF